MKNERYLFMLIILLLNDNCRLGQTDIGKGYVQVQFSPDRWLWHNGTLNCTRRLSRTIEMNVDALEFSPDSEMVADGNLLHRCPLRDR